MTVKRTVVARIVFTLPPKIWKKNVGFRLNAKGRQMLSLKRKITVQVAIRYHDGTGPENLLLSNSITLKIKKLPKAGGKR
jgi:hypothetical protein